ncbi:fluoride efflux transporter FluC [Furfurilactobacillus siliginis]|uniref:Fluoride-specific ion channel FluC n=1 Tax=Furfurilactobacillus siliginis TaxID=348151 RepID=A0A0R2L428_9LACO|nr:CrcB family protein [Furfurilactobacillus siliginis]KRN96398.1 hypothetical protein IV55_GL001364 [Furfurilactobacillus siliginis]GEK29306.1 putative fluoride ion transporter CrcB 1 [Furfurilactobacillus siliginis]
MHNLGLAALAGVGASVGALLRYTVMQVSKLFSRQPHFPWPTFLINITGSFCLGVTMGSQLAPFIKVLIGAGILGGFTTFSTMANEIVLLIDERRWWTASSYVLASTGCGLLAAWIGFIVL